MTPHKCPVCDGTGLVSRPPGVAGDQETWSSSSVGPYECRVCKGKCIVWEPNPGLSTIDYSKLRFGAGTGPGEGDDGK